MECWPFACGHAEAEPVRTSLFFRTFLQMMLSDGILHENERELLAELLFLLQAEGIELNRIGLG